MCVFVVYAKLYQTNNIKTFKKNITFSLPNINNENMIIPVIITGEIKYFVCYLLN